jgi:hypothetical protein
MSQVSSLRRHSEPLANKKAVAGAVGDRSLSLVRDAVSFGAVSRSFHIVLGNLLSFPIRFLLL